VITIIESHPPQPSVTTVTIDLTELPRLSPARRLALRLSLALMTRVEPRVELDAELVTEHELLTRRERAARLERERLMQLLWLSTVPRR